MATGDAALLRLMRAIAAGDAAAVKQQLKAAPALATAKLATGAARAESRSFFLDEIKHHLYAGETALHVAAAAYATATVRALVAAGADVQARNRRGAAPLHHAAVGIPGDAYWDPRAQAATVAALLAAGADVDAVDTSGVTALHRAVRTRSAAAVRALLDGGADARRENKSGSTPLDLATQTTGRGGTGSPEAKAEQAEILRLLGARSA